MRKPSVLHKYVAIFGIIGHNFMHFPSRIYTIRRSIKITGILSVKVMDDKMGKCVIYRIYFIRSIFLRVSQAYSWRSCKDPAPKIKELPGKKRHPLVYF